MKYKFHFAWGHWQDHQALLELRRNMFFPDDYGRAHRHSWNRTYRRWSINNKHDRDAFMRWVGGNFARGSNASLGQEN